MKASEARELVQQAYYKVECTKEFRESLEDIYSYIKQKSLAGRCVLCYHVAQLEGEPSDKYELREKALRRLLIFQGYSVLVYPNLRGIEISWRVEDES